MPPTPVVLGAVIALVAISMLSASGLGVIRRVTALLTVVVVAAVVVPLGVLSTLIVPAEAGHGDKMAGSPERGQAVFQSAGCPACHTIAGLSTGTIGPELTRVGAVGAQRKPGVTADAYIRESIQNPNAFVVPGFAPQMPPGLASGENLEHLVAFLLTKQ